MHPKPVESSSSLLKLTVILLSLFFLAACTSSGKGRSNRATALPDRLYQPGSTAPAQTGGAAAGGASYGGQGASGTTVAPAGGSSSPASSGTVASGGQRGLKPYTIGGKTYYPLVSAHGYSEEGIASWYGPDFHGKQTANGERYDMYAMTAAHKLLPFGTEVRVTNLDNNRVVQLRINDRGPFVDNRVIDVSRSAAEQLDMIGPGTARVRLETIGTVPGLQDGDMAGRFYVQIGAFGQQANADRLVLQLVNEGLGARAYFAEQVGFWRVQIGPFSSLNQAETMSSQMATRFMGNFVVAE